MYISKKHISRRAILKGMGVTVALPFLDAMVPARTVFAKTAAGAAASRQRLVCMEMVHGSAGSTAFGVKKNLFAPVQAGRGLREHGAGRHHRVEQRQGDADAHALQDGAPGNVLLRNVH